MSSIDPLTGLKNRQSYYQQIEIDNGRIIAVVSIDMNELKYINDSYGHDKGDDAIVSVAKIIREYSGPQKLVYRVGGDEFIIFYRRGSKEEIEEKIKKMRDEVANAGYICSFGYTFKDNNTLNDMIKIADKNMYEDKQAVKKEILDNGGVLHPREDQIEIKE